MLLHAYAVVGDSEFPVGLSVRHGDAHGVWPAVAYGIADRFLGDAQELVLVFRLETCCYASTLETDSNTTGYRRALREQP